MRAPTSAVTLSPELELERTVSLAQAADLSDLSVDTIKRNHGDKIVRLSRRRLGIKLKHALALSVSAA